jgi:hypothetical protein
MHGVSSTLSLETDRGGENLCIQELSHRAFEESNILDAHFKSSVRKR